MARKKKASGSESAIDEGTARGELIYESNPKHGEPWQTGKKGSLCEAEVRPLATQLLRGSHLWGDKRYAVHEGRAYCAQEHLPNRWHGYPIGWRDVPAKLRTEWVKDGRVKKRQIDRFWK
jgi:hypothetical protein